MRAVAAVLLVFLVFFLVFGPRSIISYATHMLQGKRVTYLSLSMFAPTAPAINPPMVPSAPPPILLPRNAPLAPPMSVEPRPRSPSAGPPGAPG